jgi:transposase InsO family protein
MRLLHKLDDHFVNPRNPLLIRVTPDHLESGRTIHYDNGGIYTSKEITLIRARLGCILRHAPLRDGASKGKIELFYHATRERFLSRLLDWQYGCSRMSFAQRITRI